MLVISNPDIMPPPPPPKGGLLPTFSWEGGLLRI